MNTSVLSLIKALVIVAVFAIIGHIIYKNNQLAKDYESLSNRTQMFDYENYVDSICDLIKNSTYLESGERYDSLYEEINVCSQIYKSNGEKFISPNNIDVFYQKAFESYWLVLKEHSNMLFRGNFWDRRERKELSAEIQKIRYRQGVNRKDSLNKYEEYLRGYDIFSDLLDRLEHCNSKVTYEKHTNLYKYEKYPYCYLSDFQDRRKNAKENAKESWKSYISTEYQYVSKNGDNILNQSRITLGEVESFGSDMDDWKTKVISYQETTGDGDIFGEKSTALYKLYEKIANKYNNQYY